MTEGIKRISRRLTLDEQRDALRLIDPTGVLVTTTTVASLLCRGSDAEINHVREGDGYTVWRDTYRGTYPEKIGLSFEDAKAEYQRLSDHMEPDDRIALEFVGQAAAVLRQRAEAAGADVPTYVLDAIQLDSYLRHEIFDNNCTLLLRDTHGNLRTVKYRM